MLIIVPNFMKKILLSAGEASGDLHGAHLIQTLLAKQPDCQFQGMGGDQMQAAGCKILVDCKPLGIIGATEILRKSKQLWAAMRRMRLALSQERPDLLILIDYSGFNLRLAKYAKRLGITILYYISPHVWAWRRKRMKTIQQTVNHMAVIFPYEMKFYQAAQVPVTYVGNSIVEKTKTTMTHAEAYNFFQLQPSLKTIGLVPGSRHKEIKLLLPPMLAAAKELTKKYGPLQFVLPLASTLTTADLEPYLANSALSIKLITEYPNDALALCNAVIAKSGTVTLELALLGIPMVIIYKLSALNFAIAKRVIKVDAIGLPNLVAGRHIVTELIQDEANPKQIASEISRILDDSNYQQQMRANLAEVKTKLGQTTCDKSIADVVLAMV